MSELEQSQVRYGVLPEEYTVYNKNYSLISNRKCTTTTRENVVVRALK